MRRRKTTRRGSRAVKLTKFEEIAILVVYANPNFKRTEIARRIALKPSELCRLLNLQNGRLQFNHAAYLGPPEALTSYHMTEEHPTSKAMHEHKKHVKDALKTFSQAQERQAEVEPDFSFLHDESEEGDG